MNNVQFGALTAKNYNIDFKDLKLEDLDLDKDGVISEEELNIAIQSGAIDVLDISTKDNEADQKVTKEQYDLWAQEAVISEQLDNMKNQAARDLVGQSADDIKKLVEKLNDFEAEFKENYKSSHKDLSGMSGQFVKELSKKYVEFKKDVLKNTKTAVTSRVVKNVIEQFMEEDKRNGNKFLDLIDEDATSLSDNAKRLLSNELSREAEKFIKNYDGDNLETDLTTHLKKFLAESDKEKLADAVGLWEKGKKELEDLPEEIKFMKLKVKAKNLLLTALENDITIKVGDLIVRSEAAIPAALGQFKDADSLIWAFDKAISELSIKTRAQETKEKDEARKAAAVELAYEELQKEEENQSNIFG